MIDRTISYHLFEIILRKSYNCAINYTDNCQNGNYWSKQSRSIWKKRNQNSQKTVSPHLEQNTCKNNRPSSWRFHVGIWEPCMKREKWNFDCKPQEKTDKSN